MRDPRPEESPPEPRDPEGRLGTTTPGLIIACALAGLVVGWAIRPVAVWLELSPPRVGWAQVVALYLVAVILAGVTWFTYRDLHRERIGLAPHQAVNRLVLAKACAVTGAVVAGGYLGYALTWVGVEAELAGQRIGHSLVAAGGAALMVVASLLLERACRVRSDRADQ